MGASIVRVFYLVHSGFNFFDNFLMIGIWIHIYRFWRLPLDVFFQPVRSSYRHQRNFRRKKTNSLTISVEA